MVSLIKIIFQFSLLASRFQFPAIDRNTIPRTISSDSCYVQNKATSNGSSLQQMLQREQGRTCLIYVQSFLNFLKIISMICISHQSIICHLKVWEFSFCQKLFEEITPSWGMHNILSMHIYQK